MAEKKAVESVIELFNTILKIAFCGGFALLVVKFFKFRKLGLVRFEIQGLQARLSQLRMALKGKVRKKANTFRASFKAQVSEGDMIDNALKHLVTIKFETSDDFQAYFDLSRKIVNFIQIENGVSSNEQNVENNFMSSDFKTEMEIVKVIKEMTDISSRINTRADEHNKASMGKPVAKVDSLIFQSMTDVNRIFKDENNPFGNSFSQDNLEDYDDKAS